MSSSDPIGAAIRKMALYAAVAVVAAVLALVLTCGTPYDEEDLHDAARAAGDSAVTDFKSSGEMLDMLRAFAGDAIKDTVEYYEGELELAAVIEIERPPVEVTDEATPTPAPEDPPETSSAYRFPDMVQNGVSVKETLHFSPPILALTRVGRDLQIGFSTDSLVVGLLRTEGGTRRIVAYLESSRPVRVVDAAELRGSRKTTLDRVWGATRALSCVVVGVQAGRVLSGDNLSGALEVGATGGAATACALGVAF